MKDSSTLSRPELFACQQLRVGAGGRAILPPIELKIRAGEFWAVIGRNGAGKTTWLRTLLGLIPPVGGQVRSASHVRASYLPQRSSMDDLYPLTAREVVSIGAERGWSFLGGVSARQKRDKIEQALGEVGAAELAERPFRRLSEGQKQRVLFARLVAADAELAILDEPTSAMDKIAEREAFELIRALRDRRGLTVLVVSHYLSIVQHFADRAILLDADSQQVVSGTPRDVFEHSAFRARYGDFVDGAPDA